MKKIMIADDSIAVRMEIVKFLKTEGYEIIEAVDGKDAVEKYKEQGPFALLILDYNMPNMDGLEAAKTIRDSFSPVCPMVMLTTESNSILKAKGKELGILVWIVKPVSAVNLVNVVKKITGS